MPPRARTGKRRAWAGPRAGGPGPAARRRTPLEAEENRTEDRKIERLRSRPGANLAERMAGNADQEARRRDGSRRLGAIGAREVNATGLQASQIQAACLTGSWTEGIGRARTAAQGVLAAREWGRSFSRIWNILDARGERFGRMASSRRSLQGLAVADVGSGSPFPARAI